MIHRSIFGSLVALTAVACSHAPEPGEEFIALQSDFLRFRIWDRHFTGDDPIEVPHGEPVPRYVYINEPPPSGSAQFPVGTMIVKVAELGTNQVDWLYFGMVKRGGNFNAAGAPGWEWFEFNLSAATGNLVIEWRGDVPPDNASYRCNPIAGGGFGPLPDCTSCHSMFAHNDFVMSAPLQLDRF